MQRVIGVCVAVVVAVVIAFFVLGGGRSEQELVAAVEQRLAAGDLKGARVELDAAARVLEPAARDYLEGEILLVSRDDAGAAVVLEKAHAARPGDWRIASALLAALQNTGAFARAHTVVGGYLAQHPNDERALLTSARLLLDPRSPMRDPDEAVKRLDRIAALPARIAPHGDPTAITDDDVLRLRTIAEAETGHREAALTAARAAAKSRPGDAKAAFLLGNAARVARRHDEAVAAYRRAVELKPSERVYEEQLVMELLETKIDPAEALRRAEHLVAAAPNDAGLLILLARSHSHRDQGRDTDEADVLYRKLLAREDLTPVQLQTLRRNEAVLLYDWKQGGKEGEYLDEAYALLRRYVDAGGEIDDELRDVWETLSKRDAAKHPPVK